MRLLALLLFVSICAVGSWAQPKVVAATVETEPVPNPEDAADDPCVWVHPADPASSTIIGTDKKGGIAVYDLSGKQLQYRADGKMNNVDIRSKFPFSDGPSDIVVASNRSDNSISVYRVNPETRLLEPAGSIASGMNLIYGLCMYKSKTTGYYYVFLNSESGEVQQWQLLPADKKVEGKLVRSFKLNSKTEGCVADDEHAVFYIAEEEAGIWKLAAEPDSEPKPQLVESVAPKGRIAADAEGLCIYDAGDGKGYLLASSQGDSTFAIFDRVGANAYIGSFSIGASNQTDVVTGTDGIDVISTSLGASFPNGLFVAQDDENDGKNQNFKLVPWENISAKLDTVAK